ncbi:PASTA domain-containing protein [Nocardia sp. NPDC050697]|uniref:PASTA domain-containing protein n=1 Tax=Nocardia sp. NPDC050697 TaxID=3155158 RepID=UPI0033FAE494
MNHQQPPFPNQPYPQPPYGQQYPPVPPKKKTNAWVWVVVGVVALCGIGMVGAAIDGGDSKDAAESTRRTPAAVVAPTQAVAAPTASAQPVVRDVAIPDVIGKNGAIAADELKKAGFTNVTHGSATPGVDLVVLLSNWTVVSIEPGPGAVHPTDAAIVLTLTKNNR